MSSDIMKMLNDVESEVQYFSDICEDSDSERYRVLNLKLKYLEIIALKEIVTNLYEISHFGIGTD